MKIQAFVTILLKETLDNLRDKRSLLTSIATSIGIPLAIIIVIATVKANKEDKFQKDLVVPTEGLKFAPFLPEILRPHGIFLEEGQQNLEAVVQSGKAFVAMRIEDRAQEKFLTGQPVELSILYDGSKMDSNLLSRRLKSAIQQESNALIATRLTNLGLNPQSLRPFQLLDRDLSPQEDAAMAMVMSIFPIILIVACFGGGHYLAVDITVGEREKKTLEPLMGLPLTIPTLVYAKLATITLFCFFSTLLCSLSFALITNVDIVRAWTQLNIALTWPQALFGLGLILPVCLLAAALEMLVGSYTKSIKEAQTYIQLLLVSASMPGYFLAVMDVKQAAFSVYIPTVSQYYLLNKFGRGEMVSATEIFQSSGTTLAVAALAVWGIIRLYRREGIVA